MPAVCPYEQAVTLQKFSVIVSEGDVFQVWNIFCDIFVLLTNFLDAHARTAREHNINVESIKETVNHFIKVNFRCIFFFQQYIQKP